MGKLLAMIQNLALVVTLMLPTAKEDPQAVAVQLVQMTMPESRYNESIDAMLQQMLIPMQSRLGSNAPPDFPKRMKAMLQEVMPYQEQVRFSAEIYAKHFSASELKAIIAFYNTPVGAKSAQLMPQIMGETGQKIGTLMSQRMPQAMQKHGLMPPPPAAQP